MKTLRRLGDGHLSPLDLDAIQRNLVDTLAEQSRDAVDLHTIQDPTPTDDSITFPMLNNTIAPESMKSYAQMESMDAVRLVSAHDHEMIAGMPAVEAGTLYFNVGAADDRDTLDAGAASYGMRSGEELTMEATVRYEGDAGTISMTHMDATPATETIYAANGDTWDDGGIMQEVTPTATWILKAVQVYVKRGDIASASLRVDIWGKEPTFYNLYNRSGQLAWGEAEFDRADLSDTGAWESIPVPVPYPRLGVGRKYYFYFRMTTIGA